MAGLSLFGRGKPRAANAADDDEDPNAPPAPVDGDDEGDDQDGDKAADEGDEGDDAASNEGEDENAEGDDEEQQASSAQASLTKAVGKKPELLKVTRLARAAERSRIAAILGSKEAAKRPATARSLAISTSLSPTQARETLAAMPVEGGNGGRLAAAMRTEPQPRVAPGSGAAAGNRTGGLRAAIEQQSKR